MATKLLWFPLKHTQMEMASTQRCTFLLVSFFSEPKSEKKETFLSTNSLYILTKTPIGVNTRTLPKSCHRFYFLPTSSGDTGRVTFMIVPMPPNSQVMPPAASPPPAGRRSSSSLHHGFNT